MLPSKRARGVHWFTAMVSTRVAAGCFYFFEKSCKGTSSMESICGKCLQVHNWLCDSEMPLHKAGH